MLKESNNFTVFRLIACKVHVHFGIINLLQSKPRQFNWRNLCFAAIKKKFFMPQKCKHFINMCANNLKFMVRKHVCTYLSAFLTPDHMAAETGGINLRLPTGGEAYGMPRYASTGSKCLPSNCTITPDKAPLRVWIIRDESCEGNWSF